VLGKIVTMLVNGQHYRTIWLDPNDPEQVLIIDQRLLPFEFVVEPLRTVDDVARAIRDMHVRGAGLIGATAAFGMYLAVVAAARKRKGFWPSLLEAAATLLQTRPTAANLQWALSRMQQLLQAAAAPTGSAGDLPQPADHGISLISVARAEAQRIADEDAQWCHQIGEHGSTVLETLAAAKPGEPVRVLTHCNAGWLAFVDYGTATAPIYTAKRNGIPLHVWVDETRPWNQGARLTAWELLQEGISHSLITDNCGGHLMQRGLVDVVLVGSDRTTAAGDVANKIGTYLKALAAYDNNIPFYVALPSSTIDWTLRDGLAEIPIEERSGDEIKQVRGWSEGGWCEVAIAPDECPACNPVFDVTPARLVTGLITERGICPASEAGLRTLYPERFGEADQRIGLAEKTLYGT
jgi:methylthioribose-1-phosphate isomerase